MSELADASGKSVFMAPTHPQQQGSAFLWYCCVPKTFRIPPPPQHKSVLESANPRMDSEGASGCPWSTARATAPSPGRPTPGVVKQDQSSGGSVDTTKTRSGPQRVRMSGGERPRGAAKGKPNTEALCLPPSPPAPPAATPPGQGRDGAGQCSSVPNAIGCVRCCHTIGQELGKGPHFQ